MLLSTKSSTKSSFKVLEETLEETLEDNVFGISSNKSRSFCIFSNIEFIASLLMGPSSLLISLKLISIGFF